MSDYLLIGPVLLQDFELPERIAWGGAQRLAVHRLPGGRRVIDSMGRDDFDIVWRGVFTGSDAGLRARAIDLMRADGGLWPLTWSSFFYSVVVARFEADYTRENWIPYRIACTVLRDEAEAVVEAGISVVGAVLGDLATASGFGTGIDFAPTQTLLGESGAGPLGAARRGQALGALREGEAGLLGGIALSGAALLGAEQGSVSGRRAATGQAGQLAALTAARGPVGRARVTLENERG